MENEKAAQNREQSTTADALSKVGAESGIELSETQLGDVSGGARDHKHEGEIDVLSVASKIT